MATEAVSQLSTPIPQHPCLLGIPEICSRTPEELYEDLRAGVVFLLVISVLVLIVEHLFHRHKINTVPESLLTVCLGSLFGVIMYSLPWMGEKFSLNQDLVKVFFDWFLNLYALPIIIFEAGWSLRFRDFVSQFGYIMLFAIVGTLISVVVVASLIHVTWFWHGINCWRTALAYASLISSVDPVATLSTFGRLNVDPLLFILVFGESQINDAVAITFFRALNAHSLRDPLGLVMKMLVVLGGSLALGICLACIYILILRFTRMGNSPAQAILLIFISCFLTFSIAEWSGLSGIITVLFNSIFMGNYARPHLGTESTALASFLLKQMAAMADTTIFVFCGVFAVFIVRENWGGFRFGLLVAAFCLVARFAAIVPLGMLSNGIKSVVGRKLPKERDHMISTKHMFMMWHSGLRGGVSLVLVMEMGEWVNESGDRMLKHHLVNATFVLIVMYLLVFGSTTGACLRLLGLPLGNQVPAGQELYSASDKDGWAWRCNLYLRKKVLLPLLVAHPAACDRNPSCRSACSEVSESGVFAEVIREAERAETEPEFGVGNLHRHVAVSSLDRRGNMIDLFGSVDPAHVDAMEDIVEDMTSAKQDSVMLKDSGTLNV